MISLAIINAWLCFLTNTWVENQIIEQHCISLTLSSLVLEKFINHLNFKEKCNLGFGGLINEP